MLVYSRKGSNPKSNRNDTKKFCLDSNIQSKFAKSMTGRKYFQKDIAEENVIQSVLKELHVHKTLIILTMCQFQNNQEHREALRNIALPMSATEWLIPCENFRFCHLVCKKLLYLSSNNFSSPT